MEEALKHLFAINDCAAIENDAAAKSLAAAQYDAKLTIKRIEKALAKGLLAAADDDAQKKSAQETLAKRPPRRKFTTIDPTIQKLGVTLEANAAGGNASILLAKDEMGTWLSDITQPKQRADLFRFLELWGNGRLDVERIGRSDVFVPHATLAVTGNVQPGVLRPFVEKAIEGGPEAMGFVQRFQFAVIRNLPTYERRDQCVDDAAYEQVADIHNNLLVIGRALGGAHGETVVLHFDDGAQAIWNDWRDALEHRLRSEQEDDAFCGWLSKQKTTCAALSLVFRLIDIDDTATVDYHPNEVRVRADDVKRAIGWVEVFESHARYVFAEPFATATIALAERVKKGHVKDGMTVHDLKRRHWGRLKDAEAVDAAVKALVDEGWLWVGDVDTGGRPSKIIRVNPKLAETRA